MDKNINIKVKVWRQRGPEEPGAFETYDLQNISQGSSFLEMLDILNEQLVREGKEPVVFDHDCREGICGMCSLYINGHPHGPDEGITTCQLHMRRFNDGDTITVEPWRSAGFPIIRDLMVDRSAYVSVQTPQTFCLEAIKRAYEAPFSPTFTDDASVYEASEQGTISLIPGEATNIKLTTPLDLKLAELLLDQDPLP